MRGGTYIHEGDKTSCGGEVLTADGRTARPPASVAYEGHPVSCGKTGNIYNIIGTAPSVKSEGPLNAGSLDSVSGCPCLAELIPTPRGGRYASNRSSPLEPALAAPSQTSSDRPVTQVNSPISNVEEGPWNSAADGPGFHVVLRTISREQLLLNLYESPSSAVLEKFTALNHGHRVFKAGSIVLLGDPTTQRCTREEASLMAVSRAVQMTLAPLSESEADFMMQHREEIAGFLGYASTSVGIGEVIFARHIHGVKALLLDIEKLHQDSFTKHGHLRSHEFFAQRKELLGMLNANLTSFTKVSIGLPDHPNLKRALGISSRSLVHHWSKAGAAGEINDYAKHLRGVTTASQLIKAGGWVGIGLGGTASYMKVRDVCTEGKTDARTRVKYTEAGGFLGELAGGAGSAAIMGSHAAALCAGLGLASAGTGTLVCGLVIVGASSYAGGRTLGILGEKLGDVIYENVQ